MMMISLEKVKILLSMAILGLLNFWLLFLPSWKWSSGPQDKGRCLHNRAMFPLNHDYERKGGSWTVGTLESSGPRV